MNLKHGHLCPNRSYQVPTKYADKDSKSKLMYLKGSPFLESVLLVEFYKEPYRIWPSDQDTNQVTLQRYRLNCFFSLFVYFSVDFT